MRHRSTKLLRQPVEITRLADERHDAILGACPDWCRSATRRSQPFHPTHRERVRLTPSVESSSVSDLLDAAIARHGAVQRSKGSRGKLPWFEPGSQLAVRGPYALIDPPPTDDRFLIRRACRTPLRSFRSSDECRSAAAVGCLARARWAGDPVACLATTFTFDPDFFEEECLARFLGLDSAVLSDSGAADAAYYVIQREEALEEARATVLVDRAEASAATSHRWDVVATGAPRGGVQHAKVSVLTGRTLPG